VFKITFLFFLFSINAFALSDEQAIEQCLSNFKKHPFSKVNPDYRVLTSKVKVLGIGPENTDEVTTEKDELILVNTTVNVLSKTTYKLLNPKGWYCFKGKVTVLGSTLIELDCRANLTSSNNDVTVLGSNNDGVSNGVTVLGSTSVKRVNCK
jgi:hypothetical protein